jgi:hypothetical protein
LALALYNIGEHNEATRTLVRTLIEMTNDPTIPATSAPWPFMPIIWTKRGSRVKG